MDQRTASCRHSRVGRWTIEPAPVVFSPKSLKEKPRRVAYQMGAVHSFREKGAERERLCPVEAVGGAQVQQEIAAFPALPWA